MNKFFHSGTWSLISTLLIAFAVVFWLATVFWVWKDARRRIADRRLVWAAEIVGAIPPFLGPLVYMLFRPPEYLEDVRERELEIKAFETRLGGGDLRCGVCGCGVDHDFLVCPVCTTRLRAACGTCSKPLEPAWQVCPYCETPVPVEIPASAADGAAKPRRPPRARTRTQAKIGES